MAYSYIYAPLYSPCCVSIGKKNTNNNNVFGQRTGPVTCIVSIVRTAMDLCRANERNAAALTLTSIGQQPATNTNTTVGGEQEILTSGGPAAAAPVLISADSSTRMRSTAGTTWLLVDSNNAEHAGTTVVAQQESGAATSPERNNNTVATETLCSPDTWGNKQPTVLEDGTIVYAEVVSHSNDGIVTQSM